MKVMAKNILLNALLVEVMVVFLGQKFNGEELIPRLKSLVD